MRALGLPPRLRLIANWVPEGAYLADVGTDHGYLPTWLLLRGSIRGAIASDLRKGPLERAKATGALYGVERIDYRLCDGLSGIRRTEVDTVVIAGMGGETMLSVLKGAPWTADGQHTLLLQPQTHEELVRAYLANNGFMITREALVQDRGTLYADADGVGRCKALRPCRCEKDEGAAGDFGGFASCKRGVALCQL